MRREHRSNAQHSRWSGWSAVAWPGCRMQLLHPLLASIFLAAGEGCEPSLTDPEGDVQPQKVQAAPPCSKSSTTLRLLPSFSEAWNRNRRRFVDVEQDRGIVFPLNSRQLYLPGAAFPQQGTEVQGWSSSILGCTSGSELPRTPNRRTLEDSVKAKFAQHALR